VVGLVAIAQPLEDLDGLLLAGRLDEDGLEPAFERPVLLDVLAVLVERGGTLGAAAAGPRESMASRMTAPRST
jgi:hypothetical protein